MKTDIGKRFSEIREDSHLNKQHFADSIKIPSTTVSDIELSKREPSKDILLRLASKYRVNLHWMLTGDGEKYVNEVPQKEEKHPFIVELEAIVDRKLEQFKAQMAKIEGQLKGKSTDSPDSGMFTSDPEPEYAENPEPIIFVESVAAGKPISQSEARSTILVPRRYIKTRPEDYYVARIKGTSMISAGIPDGCLALFRISDMPRDGGIQIVEWDEEATVKRIREVPGKGWKICFDDGTKRHIDIAPGEEPRIQGDFIAVLPEDE